MFPNGKATRRETRQRFVQTLQISCDAGYSASTPQLNCHEGQWNLDGLSLETICTRESVLVLFNQMCSISKRYNTLILYMVSFLAADADLCGPPPKVENAVITTSYQKEYLSDSRVTYQCRDKYIPEGEETIRCERGEWKKNVKCIRMYIE